MLANKEDQEPAFLPEAWPGFLWYSLLLRVGKNYDLIFWMGGAGWRPHSLC